MTPEIAQGFATTVALVGSAVGLLGTAQFAAWLWQRRPAPPAADVDAAPLWMTTDCTPPWWTAEEIIAEWDRRAAAVADLDAERRARLAPLQAECRQRIIAEAEARRDGQR